MRYPYDTLEDPKVILDYDGYLANNPDKAAELGDVIIVSYRPGSSHPTYSMCDTVAMTAEVNDNLNAMYHQAKKAAPLIRQAIFFGKGVNGYGSREDACAVCVDRSFRQRQKQLC